jgi:predicted permease
LLFLLGGAAGLALAQLMTGLLARTLPSLPAFVDTSLPLDYHVVLFTGAVSLAAALAAGLLPAWQSSRADVIAALKSDAQGPAERLRLRHGFVVAQVALSIALVAAAGLFAGAIHRSGTVESGFDASGVENTNLDLTLAGYTDSTGPAFVRELSERVRELPRVANATVAGLAPGTGRMELCCGIAVPGVEPPNGEEFFHPAWNVVEPGFFGTLRVPLRGRDFGPEDRRGTVPVAIVNESAARQYWGAADPLGKQILWQQTPGTRAGMRGSGAQTKGPMLFGRDASARRDPIALTVIGVAADMQPGGRERKDSIYLPFQQRYQSDVSLLVRSNDGESVARELRSLIASMDPNLPVISSEALGDRLGPVQLQLRLATGVSAGAGLVGVLLAGIGLYGVTAYAVTRRTREIGVRIAMGARPSDITRLVLGHGMVLVLIGTVVGLALAALAGRVLAHNRFGIPAVEPLTFAGAAAVLALVGLTACYVPMRRATRINPVDALRYE